MIFVLIIPILLGCFKIFIFCILFAILYVGISTGMYLITAPPPFRTFYYPMVRSAMDWIDSWIQIHVLGSHPVDEGY